MKSFTNYWNKILNYGGSQKGVVLVIVTLALVLLTAIITSAHFTIVSQTTSSSSYRLSTQAAYVAEAGIQRAMDWFSHSYSPSAMTGVTVTTYPPTRNSNTLPVSINNVAGDNGNYPDGGTIQGNFRTYLGGTTTMTGSPNNFQIITGASGGNPVTGQYIVTATLLATKQIQVFPGIPKTAEKWRIDSIGRLLNGAVELARSDNSTIIETLVTPAINDAVCVKDDFRFNGQTSITSMDSYDSSVGMYGTGNMGGQVSIGSFSNATGSTYGFDINGNGVLNGTINIPENIPSGTPARPTICGNANQGCGETYCDSPDVPTFVENVSYPEVGLLTGRIPDNLLQPNYFYKAAACPTGCLTSNDCAPPGTNTTLTSSVLPTVGLPVSYGPIIKTILGSDSRIGLTSGFSGDACIWVQSIGAAASNPVAAGGGKNNVDGFTAAAAGNGNGNGNGNGGGGNGGGNGGGGGGGGFLIIDNLSNRTGQGALNIFVSNVDIGNRDLKVVSNKSNPVNIYVRSSFSINGNGNANNNTDPSPSSTSLVATYKTQNVQGLKIFGKSNVAAGSGPTISLDGGGNGGGISAIIYSPKSDITVNGGVDIYGSIVANTYRKNGTAGIHYDRQLQKDFVNVFNFVPANQIRKIR